MEQPRFLHAGGQVTEQALSSVSRFAFLFKKWEVTETDTQINAASSESSADDTVFLHDAFVWGKWIASAV